MSVGQSYLVDFKLQLEEIENLISTPNQVRDFAVSKLKDIEGKATVPKGPNGSNILKNAIKALENLDEESLESSYKVIFRQTLVLATSTLEATLKKYFEELISKPELLNKDSSRLGQIKITAKELANYGLDYSGAFAKLILDNERNSFQNLKKIKDTFSDYLNISLELDEEVEKKLIFYLESRHVLVHKSGIVDDDFIRNASKYLKANLHNYSHGDNIKISEKDWGDIKHSYTNLVGIVEARAKNM